MENRDTFMITLVLVLVAANIWTIYQEIDGHHQVIADLSKRVDGLQAKKEESE